ncbi:helix-turn-helix domain-containing protein [Frankia sp. Cj3]|uniref:helix-turn-helix domain-containing protein n=1 Tax=Frankia sp. Cj3 TaxID=2880976 RepID=UPI001EF69CCF|nr:helix-turn-helix domain-containing protein [Frankia sp. Cj3]
MSDIQVTTTPIETIADTPYDTGFVARAKEIGGRWDGGRQVWTFDPRDDRRVRDLVIGIWGTDGSEPEGDIVTVQIKAERHGSGRREAVVRFAGRVVATRRGRDCAVELASGVVVISGGFTRSGGSMRYPEIGATDAVLEIRDLPRAALARAAECSYTIVSKEPAVQAAPTSASAGVPELLAERDRLLARIAEIDALLPEPEGVETTTRQAAAALGVSIRTVQRWATAGKIAARKDDKGNWLITITISV